MNDIICPNCGKAFKIDETGYADILKQVRDKDFEKQIHERLEVAEKEKLSAIELAEANIRNKMQETAASKDSEIQELKAKLNAGESAQKLAVAEALNAVEKERDKLANELEQAKRDNQTASKLAEAKRSQEIQETAAKKDAEILDLKARLEASEDRRKIAVNEAVSVVEKERDKLKNDFSQSELRNQLAEQSLKEKYETQLKDRDEAIERLRDMKARLSTKMVGETLEQHCEIEFNRIRATAFPTAYFEKDNDASTGSKGDYIFRESNNEDIEVVSIMFEMKNENDTTATKKKMKTSSKSWIRIEMRKTVNMRYWCHCWSRITNSTIPASWMSLIGIRRCM